MWARIDIDPENRELESVAELTDIDPDGRFHPSLVWIECLAGTQQGYIYDGSGFIPPIPV
ncbi:hypothetical protein KQ929_11990 [Leclercia pneumoniae]|uniref:Phage tail protein n=1 Tax=Leclercia pneumoniae TaxID=2815358 RepID=A0ABX8JRJ2_9ENTR|nr:hypothetical protein [Leclercia pneumoniae]QSW37085.1 hypothetical protein JZ655_08520 [Leclercia pneumoniae]QWW77999.1 hypothetical protein KQ929_11990 [Leclercia pneumoniae]